MATRLFHFSEDDTIRRFEPRPVRVPSQRPAGREWLNGPLVWAIDEWHQPMYLFPRDCPRILIWRLPHSTGSDVDRYLGATDARMVACVESRWLPRIAAATLHRYELPADSFESLDDAGMWVSASSIDPIASLPLTDLPTRLAEQHVQLRVMNTFEPLMEVWTSTLHASGIRLRHARGIDLSAARSRWRGTEPGSPSRRIPD